jgi:hypothetical protein
MTFTSPLIPRPLLLVTYARDALLDGFGRDLDARLARSRCTWNADQHGGTPNEGAVRRCPDGV